MRKTVIPAMALVALAGLGGYGLGNHGNAQGAPEARTAESTPPASVAPEAPWRQGGEGRGHHRHGHHRRDLGLFFPQRDKNLSVADAQVIAQAMLLRHGNHSWKVGNATQNQDDTVSFAIMTQSGEVIARFAMDIHTGRMRRIG